MKRKILTTITAEASRSSSCWAQRGQRKRRTQNTVSEHGPAEQYLIADRNAEIALARSAARPILTRCPRLLAA